MLESIEIIIDVSKTDVRIHDLIEKFSAHNYNSVEFTVHVENSTIKMRLLNQHVDSVYDGNIAVENFCNSIQNILTRHYIPFSVIEYLNLDVFSYIYSTTPTSS